MSDVREPAVAGTFYPGNADVLKADIEGYLRKVPDQALPGPVCGIVAPHAGYMYSGQAAAYGYKTVMGSRYDTVIIIAPSHRSFFVGAAVQARGGYRTPLGTVPVDRELAVSLVDRQGEVHEDVRVHAGEHSIEVQIPFLQCVLQDFAIVPLILGTSQDPESSDRVADVIYDCIKESDKRYLIVGSTDLSHYYPYDLAVEMDKAAVDMMEKFDIEGLSRELVRGKYEACGAGAIITTMKVCRSLGATQSKVLHYVNSGDVTGDMGSVVGYASCVFYGGK
jgi:AmmeMemoRadiSam system protein B